MLELIVRFTACLRAHDLRVSTSEVLDCTRQLEFIDSLDETLFKTVLKANFSKSRRDQLRFDRIYDLFFHGIRPPESADPKWPGKLVSKVKETASDDPMEQALVSFLEGDPANFLAKIQALHTREEPKAVALKSNMGQLSAKLNVMLKINTLKARILALAGDIQGEEKEWVNRRMDQALDLLSRETATANDSLKSIQAQGISRDSLADTPFSSIGEHEQALMKTAIEELVRRLKDQVGRRRAPKTKGILDVKKTLRRAGKYQGVPIEICYKTRPPKKNRIITLCDVSGSVWSASRFMLTLLYSLQECFDRVKSFIFVAEPWEVTHLFETLEIQKAIHSTLSNPPINMEARTDYGSTFQAFREHHMNDLDRRTTLIILGDARSNHFNPQGHILAEMREKCRRIIWLNPEPSNSWGSGDSEIRTYQTHCHEVRTCMNLNHLTQFIHELVL